MTAALDPRHMTLEERSFFGLEPADHVVRFRERERLARISRACWAAARRSRFDRVAFGVSFVDVTVDTRTGDVVNVENFRP